jgi:16S rRNA pseudouridine516 synthase
MKWTLLKILTHSGLGSRKEALALIKKNKVLLNGEICRNEKIVVEAAELQSYQVDGEPLVFREKLYYLINKPRGYECSHRPSHHKSVFALLPDIFIRRGLEACGRLDVDTTGLLLFTDDGQFNKKIMSPKTKLPKTYRVTTKHPMSASFKEKITSGVRLNDDPETLIVPAKTEFVEECMMIITITEGKYHQVKRMVAAAGNRVEELHREAIGALTLEDLNLGEGRLLSNESVAGLI